MGYTNYWNNEEPIDLTNAAPAIQELLEMGMERGILAGADGQGSPVFDGRILVFNGCGDAAYETFAITPEQTGFQFTKTAQRPYDAYVKAALILIQSHSDDPDQIRIACDGRTSDWDEAADLVGLISNISLCDVMISDSVLSRVELEHLAASLTTD